MDVEGHVSARTDTVCGHCAIFYGQRRLRNVSRFCCRNTFRNLLFFLVEFYSREILLSRCIAHTLKKGQLFQPNFIIQKPLLARSSQGIPSSTEHHNKLALLFTFKLLKSEWWPNKRAPNCELIDHVVCIHRADLYARPFDSLYEY